MTVSANANRRNNVHLIVFSVISLAVAALIAQTWWAIRQDYELTMAAQARNSATIAHALEKHVNQMLERVNQLIHTTASTVGGMSQTASASPERMQHVLAREKRELQSVDALWLLSPGEKGWAISAQYPARNLDYNAIADISFLKNNPDHRYSIIGQPMPGGQSSDWIVPIMRNIHAPDGRRIGILGVSLHTAYLADFYAQPANNDEVILAWQGEQKVLLISSPFDIRVASDENTDKAIIAAIRGGETDGWFESASMFDGERRIFSYRKHPSFPVTTLYATNLEDALLPWKTRSLHRIALASAAIVFIGILALLLAAQMRRLRKSEQKLVQSEQRYRILFEEAIDGIFLLRRDQSYVDCNSAGARLFGVGSREQVIGRHAGDFSPAARFSVPSTYEDRQCRINAALAGEPQQFELAAWRHGKIHYSEVSMSRVLLNDEELVLCIHRDIGHRKQAEELQRDQNRILHLLAGGADLQLILNEIVHFLEQRTPGAQAMILLLDESRARFVSGTGPSLPQQLVEQMLSLPLESGAEAGSENVLARYPTLTEDIGSLSLMQPWHEVLYRNGFVSCSSWPVMGRRGQALGVFFLLHCARGTPSAEVTQLVGISTDLAGIAVESRHAEERIRHLAHYDELTGLPNRFLYTQHLNKALSQAARTHTPVAVFFLDLDRFKNINDTFGHEAGDKVLRNIAYNFRNSLRDADTIARVGGDEFIILIPNYSGTEQLQEIAWRLLKAAARPFEIDGQECQLSASVGIATYPADGMDAKILLKNADIAMYRAKASGRNNYQFYSAGMNSHTVERMALEASLRHAVDRGEFVVHYQPRVDVSNGRIVGAEALVRWLNPERGLVMPGEFIPIAEEAGLISQIGMQVLDTVCCDLHAFDRAGVSLHSVAINLSALQFSDASLLNDVRKVIDSRRIDPRRLEFEITESMVMHNQEQAICLMQQIREMGFALAIDDFGTGYSSLSYLKRLPVDNVKIDQSFIRDIPHGPKDTGIVQAIISMAHTLGLKVIAEGVERVRQLETLRQFGCDQYQGFYFSAAVPAGQFMLLAQDQPAQQIA